MFNEPFALYDVCLKMNVMIRVSPIGTLAKNCLLQCHQERYTLNIRYSNLFSRHPKKRQTASDLDGYFGNVQMLVACFNIEIYKCKPAEFYVENHANYGSTLMIFAEHIEQAIL